MENKTQGRQGRQDFFQAPPTLAAPRHKEPPSIQAPPPPEKSCNSFHFPDSGPPEPPSCPPAAPGLPAQIVNLEAARLKRRRADWIARLRKRLKKDVSFYAAKAWKDGVSADDPYWILEAWKEAQDGAIDDFIYEYLA